VTKKKEGYRNATSTIAINCGRNSKKYESVNGSDPNCVNIILSQLHAYQIFFAKTTYCDIKSDQPTIDKTGHRQSHYNKIDWDQHL